MLVLYVINRQNINPYYSDDLTKTLKNFENYSPPWGLFGIEELKILLGIFGYENIYSKSVIGENNSSYNISDNKFVSSGLLYFFVENNKSGMVTGIIYLVLTKCKECRKTKEEFREETGFGGTYFHWDFNDGAEDYGAIVTHAFNSAYYHAVTLTAYNQYGCFDAITKNVFVTDYLTLYVPNAFTPDDDNINDNFKPDMGGKELIVNYKFWITDRWGVTLFETNDYDEPWQGNTRGGDHYVSPGTYLWNVEVQLKNGEEKKYNGHVVLIR